MPLQHSPQRNTTKRTPTRKKKTPPKQQPPSPKPPVVTPPSVNSSKMSFTKFVSICERKIRYLSQTIIKDINELTDKDTLGALMAQLEALDEQKIQFQEVIDRMEGSEDPERSDRKIDELAGQFKKFFIQARSKLLDLQGNLAQKSSPDGGNTAQIELKNRLIHQKMLIKQIHDVEVKISALKGFNDGFDAESPPSATTLQYYVNQLMQIQSSADAAFATLHSILDEDNETEELESKQTAVNERISLSLSVLLDHLDKANASNKVEKSNDSANSKIKLESLKIPEFHGDPTEWISFRDKFKALIHDCKDFTNVVRFSYLQLYLKDKNAPASLKRSATDDGYIDVWKDVCNQYDNDRNLIRSLFDALLKVKHMSDESENEMKRVRNELQACVDSISRIESCTDPFSAIVAHIGLFRMDSHSRDLFETKNENQIPVWKHLSEFLDQRSKTLGNCVVTPKSYSKNFSSSTVKQGISSKPQVKIHTVQTVKSPPPAICNFCKGNHFTSRCSQISNLKPKEMLKKIEENKLCSNCLGRHNISDCSSKSSCMVCSEKHFSKLHDLLKPTVQTHHLISTHKVSVASHVMLSTGIIYLLNGKGKWIQKRALLDSGATKGFMKTSCADELGITQNAVNIFGSTVSNQKINIKSVASTKVKNFSGSFECALEFNVVQQVTSNLPHCFIPKSDFEIPDGFRLADPSFNVPSDCDVLIGNDVYEQLRLEGKRQLKNGIILKNTVFGWIITGPLNVSSVANHFAGNFQAYNLSELNESIQKFWKDEDYRKPNRFYTDEEAKVEENFQTTFVRDENGKFEVSIPFNSKVEQLANNYNSALHQFLNLEKRLAKNPELRKQCKYFMQEYIDRGDMSPVDIANDRPNHPVFYFSYHPVMKSDSTTTKVRIVFNGSLKTASGLSLNDTQCIGPNIQTDTSSLLMKFRIPEIVATADIAKMYRMFKITESQRSLQRIIYRSHPTDPIQVWQLNTVTYGTRAASFLATRCVKQLAIDTRDQFPDASHILEHNTYVDDVIFGYDSLDQQIKVTKDLLTITEGAGLDLRKFKSNKLDAIEFLPPSKREIDNEDQIHKALGIKWNTEKDSIQFSFHHMPNVKLSKRIALSEISQIYDPNGLLGPITFMFKTFMRSIHQSQKNWDQLLSSDFQDEWLQLASSSKSVNSIRIPRHAVITNATSLQLHGFSDASKLGYGACVYLVSSDAEGNIMSHLVSSRSRLAGETQMPRLEVNGGVILAHMITQIGQLLGITQLHCWMDSMIGLCWIAKQPANLKEFIANRIRDIQVTTRNHDCIWRHVATHLNPADVLSRGMTADEFHDDNHKSKLWWNGAPFLQLPKTEWPTSLLEVDSNNPDYICELRKFPLNHFFNEEDPRIDLIVSCHQVSDPQPFAVNEWIFNEKIFSSTWKIKARLAIMCRFIFNCRAKTLNNNKRSSFMSKNHPVSIADYRDADILVARIIQMQHYPLEFKSLKNQQPIPDHSKLIRRNAHWNSTQGVIRLGNRGRESSVCVDMKFPLPVAKCHYTRLRIAEIHREDSHSGVRTTAATFGMRYWMPDIHSVARNVIHYCIKCFRCNPKLDQQYMGDLPSSRVQFTSAFHNTGVDYAGPFEIKASTLRKAPRMKAYIAVFVCMATGAVHIEVVTSLCSDAFIQAFHRFVSRRGLCNSLISDNAGNFVGTANEQKDFKKFLEDHHQEFQEFFRIKHVEYKTIPPRSPNFGGIWENKVKQLKRHLYPSIGNTTLTFEELSTICCRIEAVLNSRPLSYIDSDPNDPQPLTPGHFLIGKSLLSLPEEDLSDQKISDMKRYRRTTQIFQHFHKRWLKEYLPQLQKRTKNFTRTSEFKVGQVVLMCEENAPPQYWPLAIIESVTLGKDNLVRVVHLRTSQGKTFTRAVSKISTLPISDNIDAHHFSAGECYVVD